jgi:hypothetical protein
MSSTPSVLASDLSFAYVDCDIPEGLTVVEWRRARHAAQAAAEGPVRRRFGRRSRRR